MGLLEILPEALSQALELALGRRVVPSELGSRQLREELDAALRARSVFSARTTHAGYLQYLREAIERALQGGYNNDLPQLKAELRTVLTSLKYTPETGFPGDEELGIPPAEPGSLRDLGSEKRLNLILDTEIKKHRGAAQKARGLDPERLKIYPAYELVRIQSRRVPRGLPGSGSLGWQRRWFEVKGPMNPKGRLVALKNDDVWRRLGSSENFEDALDLDHSPFAFGSGYGLRDVPWDEAKELGLDVESVLRGMPLEDSIEDVLPTAEKSVKDLDDDMVQQLRAEILAERGGKPGYVRYNEMLKREVESTREDYLKKGGDR